MQAALHAMSRHRIPLNELSIRLQFAQHHRSLELSGLFLPITNILAYRESPVVAITSTDRTKWSREAWSRPLGTNGTLAVKAFRRPLTPYLSEDGEQHEAR